MFELKTPCVDCPFVKGSITNLTLHPTRIKGIVDGLHQDGSFTCHKTIDYSNDFKDSEDEDGETEFIPTDKNQFCAGALLYLEREGHQTQAMQVFERLGCYDPSKLRGMDKIIDKVE
ncbi:hypothetical protein LAV82_23325 [Bacillus sp. ILBB4]|nr:hypothetical protein [Bacillus sp. ILBB4]